MKNIWVVYKNSDMTEGRGPMVMDSIWDNEQEARKYMDDQPGVMGRKVKWGTGNIKYGDWEIEETKIHSSKESFQQEKDKKLKETALLKLTKEEKRVLGLN